MLRILALLALIVLVLMPAFASVQTTIFDCSYRISAVQNTTGARVDWVRQAILVTSTAIAPPQIMGTRARDAARTLALESARSIYITYVNQMHLTAYASVTDAIATCYLPKQEQEGLGKDIQPVVETWDTMERSLALISAIPLCGPGSPNVIAARMLKIEQDAFAKQHPVQWYKNSPTAATHPENTPASSLSNRPYTGIILDCTKMHYEPVLLPKLVAKDGTVLWGLQDINQTDVMQQGMMGYSATLRDAKSSLRVGMHPCIIRPSSLCGPLRGDLMLSAEDTRQLAEIQAVSECLNKLAVIAVID